MTNFEDLNIIREYLITYYTGSIAGFGVLLTILFMGLMISRGISLRYTVIYLIPFIGGITVAGFLGASNMLFAVWILIASVIYAMSMYKILTR
jgi:uncharacterized membrane protein YoaK (UPF0700 family)